MEGAAQNTRERPVQPEGDVPAVSHEPGARGASHHVRESNSTPAVAVIIECIAEAPAVAIKIECIAEDANTAQVSGTLSALPPGDTKTDVQDCFVKKENSIDDVTIKQELDIRPRVPQLLTASPSAQASGLVQEELETIEISDGETTDGEVEVVGQIVRTNEPPRPTPEAAAPVAPLRSAARALAPTRPVRRKRARRRIPPLMETLACHRIPPLMETYTDIGRLREARAYAEMRTADALQQISVALLAIAGVVSECTATFQRGYRTRTWARQCTAIAIVIAIHTSKSASFRDPVRSEPTLRALFINRLTLQEVLQLQRLYVKAENVTVPLAEWLSLIIVIPEMPWW